VEGGPRFSAAPTALRSFSGLIPSPPGLGWRLAAGPPGLASVAILECRVYLNFLSASWLLGMTKGRAVTFYWEPSSDGKKETAGPLDLVVACTCHGLRLAKPHGGRARTN
jgi:hypothetical protein